MYASNVYHIHIIYLRIYLINCAKSTRENYSRPCKGVSLWYQVYRMFENSLQGGNGKAISSTNSWPIFEKISGRHSTFNQ